MSEITPKDTKLSLKEQLLRALLFLICALFITYFMPRESKFRYSFQENRPWRYGLLTATFDFPVYKSEETVKRETDSLLQGFIPYYRVDLKVETDQTERLEAHMNQIDLLRNNAYAKRLIVDYLKSIYRRGVVSNETMNQLVEEQRKDLFLVKDNIAERQSVDQLYTHKMAYEALMGLSQSGVSEKLLRACELNGFIVENVNYDEIKSNDVIDQLKLQLSETDGMVQAGERIIDRGEIVSPKVYRILQSLERETKTRVGSSAKQYWIMTGEFLLVAALFGCMFFYLRLFRHETFFRKKMILFILLLILALIVISLVVHYRSIDYIYLVPYAIVPLVVRTFFDSRTALFAHLVTVLISSIIAPFPYEFIILQVTVGMMAIFTLKDLTQRSQIVQSAIIIFFTYSLIYTAFTLIQEGDWSRLKPQLYLLFFFNSSLLLFSYLLIYIFEKLFGFISGVTLVELSNINSPILRQFSEVCPGTFQHTMQVSNLSAAAASAISANVQLARTGALFHDIGKMENPAFFIENQNGINPHDKLEYDESAQIIISHVESGVKIALKENLPEAIIDFIRTHHGDGVTKYFYNSFRNKYPDREIDLTRFTYPGPKPFTRETAIVMLADSVEATSRSLKEYSEENITALVHRIVDSIIADGLLRNAPLTFKDVEIIKKVFVEKLKTVYHVRISYPELKIKENSNK